MIKKIPLLLLRCAIFLAGAYWSYKRCAEYWFVGPVFGVVVLVWYASSLKILFSLRSAAFVAFSTLIYALVYKTTSINKISHGVVYVPVAIGTVLLPLAHVIFLKAAYKRLLWAIPGVYVVFYVANEIINKFSLPSTIENWVNVVIIWQAAYLIFMLAPPYNLNQVRKV